MRTKYKGCIIEVEEFQMPYRIKCGLPIHYLEVDRMFSCCIHDKKEEIYSGITTAIGHIGVCVDEMKIVVDKYRDEQKKRLILVRNLHSSKLKLKV